MLRCVAAVSERQLQAVPWQAAGLLRAVCLQQQLPFASFHHQRPQQQSAAQQGCTQQPATSQTSSLSQQVQEPPLRRQRRSQQATRTLWRQQQQQHLALQPFNHQQEMQQQQRVYSSMTSAAHYHARHSGVCVSAGHRKQLSSLCCPSNNPSLLQLQTISLSLCTSGCMAAAAEYKMESLLIFESCWRRFEERYGMVGGAGQHKP